MHEQLQRMTFAHLQVLTVLERAFDDEGFLRAARELRTIALAHQRDGNLEESELMYAYAMNLVRMIRGDRTLPV